MENKNTIIEKIRAYLEEHEELFNTAIEELDSYNGYLGDNRHYCMDDIDELFTCSSREQGLSYWFERAFYGYDADSYSTDAAGNRTYTAFNPNREYFYFNGYGNLVSTDYIDYSDMLDNYCVEQMSKNRMYISSIDDEPELSALFDELEAA